MIKQDVITSQSYCQKKSLFLIPTKAHVKKLCKETEFDPPDKSRFIGIVFPPFAGGLKKLGFSSQIFDTYSVSISFSRHLVPFKQIMSNCALTLCRWSGAEDMTKGRNNIGGVDVTV